LLAFLGAQFVGINDDRPRDDESPAAQTASIEADPSFPSGQGLARVESKCESKRIDDNDDGVWLSEALEPQVFATHLIERHCVRSDDTSSTVSLFDTVRLQL